MSQVVEKSVGLTRRRLLEAIGMAGGAAAVYETMTALGLLHVPAAYAGPPQLAKDAGKGQSVVILGAGVAGLTAAYEFSKAGFKVTVLEAKAKPGGRSLTLRPGDSITEVNERGEQMTQTCTFDAGLYLNAGPGRLPYHHTQALKYCKELGVKLEPYIMSTQANFYQKEKEFDGRPMPRRRIEYDTRGYVSELLAKAINKGALDTELSANDKKLVLDLLTKFGMLSEKDAYKYLGSSRSGFKVEPGVKPGIQAQQLPFQALLSSQYWAGPNFYQPDDYLWQDTLFQPVGGMDMLWKGFLPAVDKLLSLSREVRSITNITDKGMQKVRVVHRNAKTQADEQVLIADWCISTIPMHLLSKLENNFSEDFRKAISTVPPEHTCKVGWQADRRFWEDEQIYGGISFTTHPITQMWYPSSGFLEQKGVLTGAYNYGDTATRFGALGREERLKKAMEGARLLHPQTTDKDIPIAKGISIAWQNIPFQNGGWASWDKSMTAEYERLLEPDGRVWVAGDQVSQIPGWQEGAIRSALWVHQQITQPKPVALAEQKITAPDAREVTRGHGQ
jgi:monoamine oxidase